MSTSDRQDWDSREKNAYIVACVVFLPAEVNKRISKAVVIVREQKKKRVPHEKN